MLSRWDRPALLVALTSALALGLAGTAAGTVRTSCFELPTLAKRSLIATQITRPGGRWSGVGQVRNTIALRILVKGPQGEVNFSTQSYKVIGTVRSDLQFRPTNVEAFTSVGTVEVSNWHPGWAFGVGYPIAAPVSLTLDKGHHTVTSRAPTGGRHAVYRFTATSPFLYVKANNAFASQPKLTADAVGEIGIANGVGVRSYGSVSDTASVPNAAGKGDIREEGWRRIDCRTGFDGKPRKSSTHPKKPHPKPRPPQHLPRTLPGTYTCNFIAQAKGNWVSFPAYGATSLRLRSNGTYIYTPLRPFRASPAYPTGRFSRSESKLRFQSGYLKGVTGTWRARVSGASDHAGISLTAFRYGPDATAGPHACVKP